MGKDQFLRILRRRLRGLPAEERERILSYYREMIEDRVEGGEPERDAVRNLGDVHFVAQKILAENPNRRPRSAGKIVAISAASLFGAALVACIALAVMSFRAGDAYGFGKVGGNQSGSSDFEYKTYTAKAGGVGTVQIRAENKMVVFRPCDGDSITVEYAANRYQNYQFSDDNGKLTLENRDQSGWHSWGWDADSAPKITVSVPRDYSGDIQIDTSNSEIRASDFTKLKDLKFNTSNSSISLASLATRNVELETANAAIYLSDVSAASGLSAETQNAVISFNKISAAKIRLDTQNALISGSVSGKEDDYTIDSHTTNAVSNLNNRDGGSKELSVYTTNAIISVKFEG